MKLVYQGPAPAVEFELPDGTLGYAERDGEPVDVPSELGERLLEQPANWREHASAATSDKKPAKAGKEG